MMKTFMIIICVAIIVLALCACKNELADNALRDSAAENAENAQNAPNAQNAATAEEEPTEVPERQLAGGWTPAADNTVTDEHLEIISKATAGLTGAVYEPIEFVGTQVVSGINYKFLCKKTVIGAGLSDSEVYLVIYKDLSGNCSVLSVEEK